MATTVYYYKLWCNTDNQWEYVWRETDPVVCPTNSAHTIDTNSISIVNEVSNQEVKIIEETSATTGHHYRLISRKFASQIAANDEANMDLTFPYPISIVAGYTFIKATQEGDNMCVIVSPDTTIGAITADITATDTVVKVQQSVIDNTFIGAKVRFTDLTTTTPYYEVLSKDEAKLEITVDAGISDSLAAATPTYVQFQIVMCEVEISGEGKYGIGEHTIGGSTIPANTVIRFNYKTDGGNAAQPMFYFETYY